MTTNYLVFDDELSEAEQQQDTEIIEAILIVLEQNKGADYGAKWSLIRELAEDRIREITTNIEV